MRHACNLVTCHLECIEECYSIKGSNNRGTPSTAWLVLQETRPTLTLHKLYFDKKSPYLQKLHGEFKNISLWRMFPLRKNTVSLKFKCSLCCVSFLRVFVLIPHKLTRKKLQKAERIHKFFYLYDSSKKMVRWRTFAWGPPKAAVWNHLGLKDYSTKSANFKQDDCTAVYSWVNCCWVLLIRITTRRHESYCQSLTECEWSWGTQVNVTQLF